MASACPVCSSELEKEDNLGTKDSKAYVCPRCGEFEMSRSLLMTIEDKLAEDKFASTKISHAIRTATQAGEVYKLNTHNIEEICARSLPTPKEQADLLIRLVAKKTGTIGEYTHLGSDADLAVIGAHSLDGFRFVLSHLIESKMLTQLGKTTLDMRRPTVTLSFGGWNCYEKLNDGKSSYRRAFIALKFGDESLNRMVDKCFKPAVKQTGFELVLLSDVPKAGLIDNHMRVEIQASDFVLADLTHGSLGAYWEAGYAEGLGKPVIYLCEKKTFENNGTHFDTDHHLTIVWDESDPEEAAERLKAAIRATLPDKAQLIDAEF